MPFGTMGENLAVSGLDEYSVCIDDIYETDSLSSPNVGVMKI